MKRKLGLIFLGIFLLCGGVLAVFYPEPWYQMVDAGNQSLYNVENISVNHNVTALNFIGNLTGDVFGNVSPMNWTNLKNYPLACPGSSAITAVNDSVTCSDLWVNTAGDNMTGPLSVANTSPLAMFSVNGTSHLGGNTNISGNLSGDYLNISFGSNIDLNGFNITDVFNYDLVEDDIPSLTSTWDNTMDADRLVGVDFLNNNITIKWANITDVATSNWNFTNDAGYWNDTYATFNKTYGDALYYEANNPEGYYNSSDFVITDYYTKAIILGFNHYNSSDFSISDYYTKAETLNLAYYNSSDFVITDYYTKADVLGFNHYNSSDFSISDYYTKADVLGFNHYNSSDFSISDYALNTTVAIQGLVSEGNISLQDNITFRWSEYIDNMDDGWLRLAGDTNLTGVLSVAGNGSPALGSIHPFFIVNATGGGVGINNGSPLDTFAVNRSSIFEGPVNITGDLTFIGSGGMRFGEIYATDNGDAMTLNSAAKVQVTIFDTNGLSNGDISPDHGNDHITMGVGGIYLVTISMSVNNNAAQAHVIDAVLWKNNGGTEFGNLYSHRSLTGGSTDVAAMSLSGIITVDAGDTLEVWMDTSDAADRSITVVDITLSVVQIGG